MNSRSRGATETGQNGQRGCSRAVSRETKRGEEPGLGVGLREETRGREVPDGGSTSAAIRCAPATTPTPGPLWSDSR